MAFTGKGSGSAAAAAGGKTLSNLETICEYYGWKDRSSAGETELDNFINHTIQLLSDLAPWPEYHRVDGAQAFNRVQNTLTNITGSGSTVTVTSASHTVATNDVGDITGTTNYNVSNVIFTDAGTNSITYVDGCSATAANSGTVTTGDQVILGETQIDRVGTVWRDDMARPLDEISVQEWLHEKRYHAATGPPTKYAVRKYTSSGLPKIIMMVYPTPTTSKMLYFTYKRYPSILSANDDTTDWPTTRMWLLSEALVTRLKAKDKDTNGMSLYSSEFMSKVGLAFNAARESYKPIIARESPIPAGKWGVKDLNRHNITITS
jgi:hypothetical protein